MGQKEVILPSKFTEIETGSFYYRILLNNLGKTELKISEGNFEKK